MHMHLLLRDNTWARPSNPRAGPRNFRAAYMEPVFHGPRCHVMGRAGLGRDETFEKKLGRVGPGREVLIM